MVPFSVTLSETSSDTKRRAVSLRQLSVLLHLSDQCVYRKLSMLLAKVSWVCCLHLTSLFNPLIATLKPQSIGLSYSNTVIGTLAVDGWAVTFGTARRGLGGAAARPGPSLLN